ncbi:MAG: aminotransferase class I/II-fold pyridoxal phosphate-dependent enzyme [Thermincola sp.]|nr:aminotransferase class I/II-fold pyridoxal phosphate-dependent enzyme [Thermincola sp.]
MSGLEQQYIAEAFATNWIAPLGPNVDMFEREVADYLDIAGAVALSSGTAAIHLALRLLNIGPGDVVFCSTLTFIASANPILYQGAEPVFIDSEPESWNMSPAALARAFDNADKMGKIPKAVIVVNLYGQSADMEPLSEICRRYNVPIIEDAAESFGATYGDRASGTFGKYGIFSFNGNKIITTSGGGMLVSDDVEGLEKARFLATQARDEAKYYQHSEIGFNYRLSNVLAGIGRGQLKVLPERIKARRAVFDRYHQAFGEIEGVEFMPEAGFGRSTRWLTALTVDPDLCGATSFEILDALAAQNIEARPLWKPLHLQPLFAECGYFPYTAEGSLADKLFARGICLPSGSNMTDEEQFVVIEAVKRCLR